MTRQAVYDYTIVHCLQSASTSTSPGCQGQGRCTCNCNGCNGRRWVDAEQHAPYTDEPTPPQHNWSGWPGAHCLNCGIRRCTRSLRRRVRAGDSMCRWPRDVLRTSSLAVRQARQPAVRANRELAVSDVKRFRMDVALDWSTMSVEVWKLVLDLIKVHPQDLGAREAAWRSLARMLTASKRARAASVRRRIG